MTKIRWVFRAIPSILGINIKTKWSRLKIVMKSLFYNDFMSYGYACDILMEPICWFVENFTAVLGPILVTMVTLLTAAVVYIAYYIGLPYWWAKSPVTTIFLLALGNWLLINVCFHYYMGVNVAAGYPPQGGLIPEAVSICKKCIKPKPPRTHHCSICNRCVLKMDHHCPWLNNCVGHHNHRHFFQYMVFTVAGVIFLMIFGVEIAYEDFFLDLDPELDGHPVRINNSEIIPLTESMDHLNASELAVIAEKVAETKEKDWRKKLILFAGLLCVAAFATLGALSWWHARLITKGETSIEATINSSEAVKHTSQSREYCNPYDFGPSRNWRIFLGIDESRKWRHVFFPSVHGPHGDGLTWETVQQHSYTGANQ